VGVEQPQLLAVMHSIERVIDVEHDAARHLTEALAIVVDHGTPHAQQSTCIRQVLQTRDGRLRAQIAIIRQTPMASLNIGSRRKRSASLPSS